MTTRPSSRIECDGGCGIYIYGRSVTEARESATEVGWVFPHKLRANGEPAKAANDVCPDCAPEFSPAMTRQAAKWANMPREERRLVTFLRMNWNLISREERHRLEQKLADMRSAQ